LILVPPRIRTAARLSCIVTLAAALAGSLFPHMGPSDANSLDKLAHVAGYAALTLQIGLGIRRERPVLSAGLVALIVGGGLELAQSWVPGRSGSWGDFAANTLGVLVGMVVCHHALTIFKKRLLPSIR
jgi:VanZ family protein